MKTSRKKRYWPQVAAMLPLWALFVWGWLIVLRDWSLDQLLEALQLLGGIGVAYLAVLIWWIRHNLAIYRRKGPRRQLRSVPYDFSRDVLGRTIRIAGGVSLTDRHMVLDIEGGQKVYRSPSPGATPDVEPAGEILVPQ